MDFLDLPDEVEGNLEIEGNKDNRFSLALDFVILGGNLGPGGQVDLM